MQNETRTYSPICATTLVLALTIIVSFILDFAEPLTLPSMMDPGLSSSDSHIGATPLDNSPPEESVAILTSMGFPRNHSIRALKNTVSFLNNLVLLRCYLLFAGTDRKWYIDAVATVYFEESWENQTCSSKWFIFFKFIFNINKNRWVH